MAIHIVDWREPPPGSCRGGAVAIGNFDGVHRGHASLMMTLRGQGQAVRGPAVALTFDPRPLELLRPSQVQPPLTTPAERARLLQQLGADHVVVLHTDHDLLSLTADQFFAQVVQERLAARTLVEGVTFGFGKNREGNIGRLAELCRGAGIGLVVAPPVKVEGVEVSSSRVRAALLAGDVATATQMLGRLYRMQGTVGVGQRRGRTLGFPTANLTKTETLVPGDGVYAVLAHVQGTAWPAAANVGPNPTFAEDARKVEVHLLGYEGDLYGQALAVDFVQRLRDTRPFAGVEDLKAQLRLDVEQARQATGT
jgi:riboflavin kinase / FMN adenylyltransferase